MPDIQMCSDDECRCGEWDKIGHCVKCFEHYADKWGELWEEIESLRSQVEILTNSYKVACRSGDLFLKRYQILRDNLSPEEYGELCELWPELKD